ncbi:uncharacterized protein LOC114532138 [Dendronephthya gigantea]|uniref:uncharacterized protein LOC114520659 n=1 Tax=Dendronephthya gigantea TaxID=151771 RepID=UPI00106B1EDE|nr:uncharacterized protein LOC114520659 [Dendronephthya gigantea]XP_028409514.1 uncharacterized protein LOC114532138 [Dendronephthya gigantea]
MADRNMSEESRERYISSINSLKELLARSEEQQQLIAMDEGSVTELFGHIQQQRQEKQVGNISQNISNSATEQANPAIESSEAPLNNIEAGEEERGMSVDFEVELFIEEIRKLGCLWNTSLSSYKDRNAKQNAWKILSNIFNKDVEFLKTQLKYLKDNLKKCLDRRSKATKSGAAASKLPTCKYFDQLRFLHGKVCNKPTESNLTPVIDVEDSSLAVNNSSALTSFVTQSVLCPETSTPTSSKSIPASAPGKSKAETEIIANTPAKRSKSRAEMAFAVDTMLVKTLKDMQEPTVTDQDEDLLFCKSLVPILKKMPARQNRLAKIKINQLLFDIEFNDEL